HGRWVGSVCESYPVVLDGRSGALTRPARNLGWPLAGSVDGNGGDYLVLADGRNPSEFSGSNVDVQAVDGRTLATLWTFRGTVASNMRILQAYAVDLTG